MGLEFRGNNNRQSENAGSSRREVSNEGLGGWACALQGGSIVKSGSTLVYMTQQTNGRLVVSSVDLDSFARNK